MGTAAQLRKQIESELAGRIPAALSPPPLRSPELISCGVAEVDALLGGGLLLGSIVELTGAPSSGRVTLALSTLAGLTRRGHCCAYVDACDTLDPLSAAAAGVELRRLLWVRPPTGGSPPPASFPHLPKEGRYGAPSSLDVANAPPSPPPLPWRGRTDPSLRLDRALRSTDLLLNAGGWSAVVLDMGDLPPEQARRVPLATWYRFRLQAEKSRALLLLLTPMACATSCASISLQSEETEAEWRRAAENGPALLAELHYRVSIARGPRQICSWHVGVERSRAASLPPKKPAASEQTRWTRTLSWPG